MYTGFTSPLSRQDLKCQACMYDTQTRLRNLEMKMFDWAVAFHTSSKQHANDPFSDRACARPLS